MSVRAERWGNRAVNGLLLLIFAFAWVLARWSIDQGHPGFALALTTMAGMLLSLPLKFRFSLQLRDWRDKDQPDITITVTQARWPDETPGMN